MQATFLGTGSAYRTPTAGNHWGRCDPTNPKNRRLCQSLLLEQDGRRLIIDTGPDIRAQTIEHNVREIDAVLITHPHYDHYFGLPEMEVYFLLNQKTIPVYAHGSTWPDVKRSLPWLFDGVEHKPKIVSGHDLDYGNPLHLAGFEIVPFRQVHGDIDSTGFRIGDLAYCTDLNALPEDSWSILHGVHTWVLECDSIEPSHQHNNLHQALQWIERLRPRKTYLTHIHPFVDHDVLTALLPVDVEVAYDGLTIECNTGSANIRLRPPVPSPI